jgi:hypothetical protein
MKPTYPLLRVHWYLLLALHTREVHAYEVLVYDHVYETRPLDMRP